MRERQKLELIRIYREQLFEAKNKLFQARSVKQLKFLQHRIRFLEEKLRELEGNGKVKI